MNHHFHGLVETPEPCLVEGMKKRRGWALKELKRRRKGGPGKVQMAGRLRKETTMPWGWIAASLVMGARGYAADCIRELLKQS
jgi:hypothetical protein